MLHRLIMAMLGITVVVTSLLVFGTVGLFVALALIAAVLFVRGARSLRAAMIRAFATALAGLCFIALLVPWHAHPVHTTYRHSCRNNLVEIGMALRAYRDNHGVLPPAQICDATDRPIHSWRTRLLPYLDRHDLYRMTDFQKPWNDPENRKVTIPLRIYRCPGNTAGRDLPVTNYVAIVGPGPPWQAGKKTAHAAETESSLNPAIVAEVAGTEIQWMEPRDLTIDEVSQSISSDGGPSHTGDCGRYEDFFWSYDSSGANVLFADGSVTYIRKGAPAELITAILHGDQKRIEELDQYWWDPERHVRWGNCFALAGLVFSVAAMLLWPRQRNRKGDGQERNCEQANDKPA